MPPGTKRSDAQVPSRIRITAAVIILVAGIVAAGLRPVTVLAQEDTEPAVDEQSEVASVRAIIKAKFDKRKWSDLTEAERVEFVSLANQLYEKAPDDPAAKNLYADCLIASGDLVKAMPVLRDLSVKNPLRGLQAAAVARRLKRFDEANAIAKRALDAMKKMSDEDPTNLSVSLAVAQNQLFLKRFDEAIKTLEKAIKLAKTPQEKELAGQAFGDAIVAQVKHLEENSKGTVAERVRILKMLRVALESSPKNPRVQTGIAQHLLGNLYDRNERIDAMREELVEAMKAAGKAK